LMSFLESSQNKELQQYLPAVKAYRDQYGVWVISQLVDDCLIESDLALKNSLSRSGHHDRILHGWSAFPSNAEISATCVNRHWGILVTS
jgi:hypothetical protein